MFDFFSVPRILFGRGKISALPEFAADLGGCVLVVHNGGDAVADRIADDLARRGVRAIRHRQKGEPTVADVDAALGVARQSAVTGVVGVGGGSAIDAAKAVAGLLANGGSALDYMEVIGCGQKITKPALSWIAVPTTAGTGAEVTRNAVIGEPSKKFKASLRSELLMAKVAIVDPELGVDVPPEVTAASGMDALCQCIEAYVSKGANLMTDGLALEGVRLAAKSLRRAFDDGGDLVAREDMAAAALISGVCLTNAGLGAVHGFAAPIGANFPAPHGVVCAALLPGVMRANLAAARGANFAATCDKFEALGRVIAGANGGGDRDPAGAIDFVESLGRSLQIPRLGRYGMKESDVAPMVELARRASSMKFNPIELPADVLAGVLRDAI